MPRHIVRLLLLMVAFAVLAYGAKQFFTVDSFYEYGHYRGKSVAEIAAEKPEAVVIQRRTDSRIDQVRVRKVDHLLRGLGVQAASCDVAHVLTSLLFIY